MKRTVNVIAAILLGLLGGLIGSWSRPVYAQSATTQVEFSYVAAHASCVPVTNTTVFCFAADSGLWLSVNGAATFTQVGAAAPVGVASVTVCNAAGASCGTPQTGVVSLNIPSKVTVTVGSPVVTATATQGPVNASLQ